MGSWFDRFINPGGINQDEGNGWPGQPVPPAGPPVEPPPPTVAPPVTNPSAGSVGGAIGGPLPWGAGTLPGVLEGWDPTKWANQSHQTHKYKVGRILAKYPPTVEGLKQALPELQAAYPGARIVGLGDLDLGLGEDPVDVLRGASQGGSAWQWLTTDEARAGGNMGVPPVAPYMGVGGGGVPWDYSGGGGDAGGGGWTMPRGSSYQFGGVPGYTSGYGVGAFGVPQRMPQDTGGFSTSGVGTMPGGPNGVMDVGAPSLSTSTSVGGTPTRSPLDTGTGYQAGAFGLPGTSSMRGMQDAGMPSLSTTGGPQRDGGPTQGEFGTGLIPTGVPIPGSRLGLSMQDTGDGLGRTHQPPQSGLGGGYDRAPSFTPLDPFKAPPVPDAYPEWKGTAFDVGPGPEAFKLPTGQQALEQDPGYQFRLEQGRKALEGSAAARGLLRSGGTLKDIQDFGQRAGSQEYQSAVDRALAVAGFNEANRRGQLGLGLQANDQNNRYGLAGSQFNADQRQRNYDNRYTAANQGYAYANQQNLAGNAQALSGYQTDVGRDLGLRGLNITAQQNAFMNSLNAQQQQWMQVYMQNGQSFDQAYRMMMARLQYPA